MLFLLNPTLWRSFLNERHYFFWWKDWISEGNRRSHVATESINLYAIIDGKVCNNKGVRL